jgi:phosphopantothenoylcysteine decarboxylase/phosphopantothenate--cysteine ligase
MGYAIAKVASARGAEVTLVSGQVNLVPPPGVEFISVVSAADMAEAVISRFPQTDIVIKAAAVADYRPKSVSDQKIKKKDDDLSIELERTQDILKYLGENKKPGQIVCGFSMETENLIENSKSKLGKKNLDLVCANSIRKAGAGFGVDTNVITLITKDSVQELPLMSKLEAADRILSFIKGM